MFFQGDAPSLSHEGKPPPFYKWSLNTKIIFHLAEKRSMTPVSHYGEKAQSCTNLYRTRINCHILQMISQHEDHTSSRTERLMALVLYLAVVRRPNHVPNLHRTRINCCIFAKYCTTLSHEHKLPHFEWFASNLSVAPSSRLKRPTIPVSRFRWEGPTWE
jgi:hypothetical protein